MRRLVLALLFTAAAAGCGHEGPMAGELSIRLNSPRTTDRAILFRLVGAQQGVSAAAGSAYKVLSRQSASGDTTWITVVTPQGTGLASGEIARVAVNDVRLPMLWYHARVLEIAAADYSLADTAGVRLAVVRP